MRLSQLTLLLLGLWAVTAHAHLEPYAPLAVGLKWKHAVVTKTRSGAVREVEVTNQITGTTVLEGKRWFVNVSRVSGSGRTRSGTTYFRPAPDGIHTLARSGRGHYEYLVTPLPLRPGLRWVSGRRDHPTVSVSGEQEVDIGDRRYPHCLKVTARSRTGGNVSTSWMAPDVGTVLTVSKTREYTSKTLLRSMTYESHSAPARSVRTHRPPPPRKPEFRPKHVQPHLSPRVD